jgi:ribonuclease HI
MKEVNIFIDAKYINDKDIGAFGYYIESIPYRYCCSDTYFNTSCPRMEMRACIEALEKVLEDFGVDTIVNIHSKQYSLINALLVGRAKRNKDKSNDDLYLKGRISSKLICKVVEEISQSGIHRAQLLTSDALKNPLPKEDRLDTPGAIPIF